MCIVATLKIAGRAHGFLTAVGRQPWGLRFHGIRPLLPFSHFTFPLLLSKKHRKGCSLSMLFSKFRVISESSQNFVDSPLSGRTGLRTKQHCASILLQNLLFFSFLGSVSKFILVDDPILDLLLFNIVFN